MQPNSQRLLSRLQQMAVIGKTPKNGVCRLALSQEDSQARTLLLDWASSLQFQCFYDEIGNQFIVKPGKNRLKPAVMVHSHLDSQPTGGRFDGVLGVLAGFEVLEVLAESGIEHEEDIILANWTNEEGARFSPAMLGSGVFAGEFSLAYAYSRKDKDGVDVESALTQSGFKGEPLEKRKFKATVELHIEQGPILEQEKKQIGVVTGVQGIRWLTVTVKGREVHAGPFPMSMRKDPVMQAILLLEELYTFVLNIPKQPIRSNNDGSVVVDEQARITVGQIQTYPGSRNTVPAEVVFSVDIRHPDDAVLDVMHKTLIELCENHSTNGFEVVVEEVWHSKSVSFDSKVVSSIEDAVKKLGFSYKNMVSGAGHDSVYISKIAPSAMIFIPCKDGLSHNEAEFVTSEDIIAGTAVLFQTIVQWLTHN